MPVHPEIAKLLATLPPADHGTRPDPAAKRAADLEHLPPLEARAAVVSVEDITAETAAGEVPVRIYTPVEATSFGLLVYFHGGAFFSGSLDTHDHVARALAKESGYKVVSVGYQLAPEAAFPTALNECYGVVRWAAEQRRRPAVGRRAPGRRGRQLGRQLRRRRHRDGPRRRLRPHHAPGPLLPVPRSRLRHRPLRVAARERRGVRARDGRASRRGTPSTSRAAPTRPIRSSPRSSAKTSAACRRP